MTLLRRFEVIVHKWFVRWTQYNDVALLLPKADNKNTK